MCSNKYIILLLNNINYIMTQQIVVSNEYKLLREIGSGSFGEVYLAKNKDNKKFAAKIEKKGDRSRLYDEYKFYKKLYDRGFKIGIPKIISFIETPEYNMLVMELLGKNLDELLEEYNGTFDINTVLKIGIDIINLLECLHETGFIHRDIKPNNFMTGYKSDSKHLYVLDFGLSKQYINKKEHINFKGERSLIGTARYASINVHMGFEPSRRDDLEAVGYMLIYFLKGKLPWQGLKKEKNDDHIRMIGDVKMSTNIKKLCENIPTCFIEYISYCKKLQFDEKPDYNYLKNLFIKEADNQHIDLKYCWNI